MNFMKTNIIRRFFVMTIGLIILGLGIAVFKVSLMGNDSYTAMTMAIGDIFGIQFSVILLCANALCFIVEIFFGRQYIGIGTFANWFGVGILASCWIDWINRHFSIPEGFFPRLLIMFIGMLVLSLAVSMYQTSNLGISPYDALSVILSERLPVSYFWCRIFTDSVCVLFTILFGGLIGLGTLVCAVGLGPFIAFFTHHISEKMCGTEEISNV